MPTQTEFQAVVMAAGKGSRMTEITAGRPKCLLPICNMPILWFPLQMLEREGFQEAIVIVSEAARSEVQSALDTCGLCLKLDIVTLPPGHDDWGTADSLKFIHDKIHSDVLVVSGDLITSVCLHPVLDLFRKNDASIATLFLPPVPLLSEPQPTPGLKTKQKPERDLVGISWNTNRLVLLASMSDFEEELSFGRNIVRRHPHLRLQSNLLDSHLYVIRQSVCDFLAKDGYVYLTPSTRKFRAIDIKGTELIQLSVDRSFSTLKGELLPYVVRKQISIKSAAKDNADSLKTDISHFVERTTNSERISNLSSFNDHWGDMQPAYQNDTIRCFAYVAQDSDFGIRVNTLQAYATCNREVQLRWPQIVKGKTLVFHHPTSDNKSTQVDETSLIGEGAKIAEKTSIRSSSIGPHSSVQPRSRITNCVLMGNVRVGEGCSVTNSVLCDGSSIEGGAELRDCVVGSNHVVSGGKHTQEVLADDSLLMEI